MNWENSAEWERDLERFEQSKRIADSLERIVNLLTEQSKKQRVEKSQVCRNCKGFGYVAKTAPETDKWGIHWDKYICKNCGKDFYPAETRHDVHAACVGHAEYCGIWTGSWNKRARCFYDLILTGGDTDKFWTDLLSK